MTILKRIAELLKKKQNGKDPFADAVGMKDNVVIKLKDTNTGEVVKEIYGHNTWTTSGRNEIRDAMLDGVFNDIDYMYQNGTSSSERTFDSKTAGGTGIAIFVATWPASPGITGITQFDLRPYSGGPAYASIIISSFSKPSGLELEVTWTTTVNTA